MALIELKNIQLDYGQVKALKGVSLRMESSELVAIVGPSGCGKTSLLRIIAGFANYSGELLIDGGDVSNLPPHKRRIGIVFQDYALFPQQTVAANITYGLRMRRKPRAYIESKLAELLALLKLDTLAGRYPSELSGGQKQRVAIARALAIDPRMLLMDEPLSALDKKLREEMQIELRRIQKRVGITTLFVTHDQEEALALADKVVVMSSGAIRQIGSPKEIYMKPADPFVAEFIGRSNFFEGTVIGRQGGHLDLRMPWGGTARLLATGVAVDAHSVHFIIRPERLTIAPKSDLSADVNTLTGTIESVTFMGFYQIIQIVTASRDCLYVQVANDGQWREGETVTLTWEPADAIVMNRA